MTSQAQAVLEQALRLDAVERAELIDALFRSFDADRRGPEDARWAIEAESRIDAFDAGKLSAGSSEEVLKRVGRK